MHVTERSFNVALGSHFGLKVAFHALERDPVLMGMSSQPLRRLLQSMQSMRGELEGELEDKVREHQRLTDEIVLLRRTLEAMDRLRPSEDDEALRAGRRRSVGGPAMSITDASTGLQILVPEAVSGVDSQADVVITFPGDGQRLMQVKRRAESLRSTRNRPIDPNGSTAHVREVLRDAGQPLDAGELHHEFGLRGWINPKWANPEGAIAQAARRAVQLGLIIQTPERTFISLDGVASTGLPAITHSLATRGWTEDAEAALALVERLYSASSPPSGDAPQLGHALLFFLRTLLWTAKAIVRTQSAGADPGQLDDRLQELEAMGAQIPDMDLTSEQRDEMDTLRHALAALLLCARAQKVPDADLWLTDSGGAWSAPSPVVAGLLQRAVEHVRAAREYEDPRLSDTLDQLERQFTCWLAGPDADPQARADSEQLADDHVVVDLRGEADRHMVIDLTRKDMRGEADRHMVIDLTRKDMRGEADRHMVIDLTGKDMTTDRERG